MFEDNAVETGHIEYFLAKVEMKHCNVMINGRNIFDHLLKNDLIRYDNIKKIATGQKDYYASDCLPDYLYFKEHYKMIAIDISKQQAPDTDPKAIQRIYFTGDLDRTAIIVFIME